MMKKGKLKPGRNIAMKVPPHEYEATVRFYREIMGLEELTTNPAEVRFEFGGKVLWIDRWPGISQSEVWFEIVTDDLDAAAAFLESEGIVRCDEIEPLGDGFQGFWVLNPANIVHLVFQEDH